MGLESRIALFVAAVLAAGPALAVEPPESCPNCPSQVARAMVDQADDEAKVDVKQLEEWIKQLDSDSYDEREEATRALKKTGDRAVKQLGDAAQGGSAEVSKRALDVLQHLYHNGDEKAKASAKKTLEKLAEGEDARVARRAKAAMKDAPKKDEPVPMNGGGGGIQIRIVGGIGGLQPAVPKNLPKITKKENDKEKRYSIEDGDKKIEIVENKKSGGIHIKVTEPAEKKDKKGDKKSDKKAEPKKDAKKKDDKKAAKPKVTEYKAKNLEELKKKHPEAAKLYKHYVENGGKKEGEEEEQEGGVFQIQGIQIPIQILPIPGQQLPIPMPMPGN